MLSFLPGLAGILPGIYMAMQNATNAAAPVAATPVAGTAAAPVGQAAQNPGGLAGLFGGNPLVLMSIVIGIFYLLVWRPQMKQRRDEEDWRKNIKKGDEVVTSGGLIGKISGVQDNIITLELQEKVRVKVLRSHIIGKPPGPGDAQPQPAASPTK